ncbi:MAG TPA: hypothetical protein VMG59_06705 [Phycisphaerae bacterium]|nr:hypothetical protein [Phycisphaerae bacterium]
MAIVVQCFQCSTILELDDGFRGGVARCSNCGALLRVPKDVATTEVAGRPRAPSRPQPLPKAASDPGISSGGMRGSGLQRRPGDPTVSSGAFSRSPRPQSPPIPSPAIRQSGGSGALPRTRGQKGDQTNFLSKPLIVGVFFGAIVLTIACVAIWQLFSSHTPQQNTTPPISYYPNQPEPAPEPPEPAPIVQEPPIVSGTLPSDWNLEDIGVPILEPSKAGYDQNTDTWTIEGMGHDVYGKNDQFSFVYKNWTGDGQISARVISIADTFDWAKAGVMFRESADANSPYVDVFGTPEQEGIAMQARANRGGSSSNHQIPGITLPVYVMIQRQGDKFTGYYSKDGTTWTQIETLTVHMNNSICVGMMLVAHSKTQSCAATLDKVTITTTLSN